ncbi:hypothetical protein GMB34_11675 [Turicibacter sanguinis]|nr:hypothetical protein [Turicibacter sanguinis]MTN84852.1 hypothetical protein [Turicibacter sanguinis]MTN87674.1 hypothetical protein [Turicibacter sanguinis]MTN90496.1 hypothetical protein [Turicibacter sanguinis]MTN93418.1 hypothetical protein [Turicibacter sanguinis]
MIKVTNETIRLMMTDYYWNTLPLICLTKEEVKRAVECATSETNFEAILGDVDVFNLEDILEAICTDFQALVAECLREINFEKMNQIWGYSKFIMFNPLLEE